MNGLVRDKTKWSKDEARIRAGTFDWSEAFKQKQKYRLPEAFLQRIEQKL